MIRLAKIDDLPEIVDIYNQAILNKTATADLHPVSEEEKYDWFLLHQRPDRPLYVWQEDNRILGWGCLSDFNSKSAYSITTEISIYIDKHCQGKNIGYQLAQYTIEQARLIPGIHIIIALVFSHNQPSLKLCQRLGFSRWGDLPKVCDMDGFLADVTILGLPLHPVDAAD